MTQFNNNMKQRIVSIITLFTLFLALNASGALAGFWRTVNETFTDMTGQNESEFLYGYGYGDGWWWYGYGYGYGYGYQNTFGYGYGAYTNSNNISEVLTALKNSFNSNGELIQSFTLPLGDFTVTLPQWLEITDSSNNPIDISTLTWYVLSTNPTISGFTSRWTVKFGIPEKSLWFSKAVKVEIPITWATSIVAKVKHHNDTTYGYKGLTLTPDANCTNGEATTTNQRYGGTSISVSSNKTIIYTCSASEFAWVTQDSSGGSSGWGGWGGWTPSCNDSQLVCTNWKYVLKTGQSCNGWNLGKTCVLSTDETQTGTTSTGTTTEISTTETPTTEIPTPKTPNMDDFTTEISEDGKVTITKTDGTKVVLSDINNSFAKDYIEKLAALGIINGYEDSTFRPQNSASRAEYLKIVLRTFNIDYSNVDTSKLTFSDVDKNSWIAKVIVKAAELNMIDTKNKNFRPNASISRSESMKMLMNAAGIETSENTVSEFSDVKGWAVKYVQKAKELGIINGQEINGKILFRPADNITRAEVSKIVVKTMELK